MEFSMNLDEFFQWLRRLAKALHAVVGPMCEVVIHDFRDLDHSVIAIEGNLSGRKPGAPLPDLNFLGSGAQDIEQDQLNYQIQIGRKTFQSSTVWIRNREGQPLGALCINMDYSKLQDVHALLETMMEPLRQEPQFVIENSFATDVQDLIQKAIQSMLEGPEQDQPARLSAARKKKVIQALDTNGVFNLRGAVEEICELLQLSRASVYNYRRK
jgi:predicted transcriptional regulator YheO